MKLPPIFDPDRKIFAEDKAMHFGITLIVVWLVAIVLGPAGAGAFGVAGIGAFELGQWDVARHVPAYHEMPDGVSPAPAPIQGDVPMPFLPGFGIGLLDLAAGGAGIVIAVLLRLLF